VSGSTDSFFQVHSVTDGGRTAKGRWLYSLQRVFDLHGCADQLCKVVTWKQQLVISDIETTIDVATIVGLVTVAPRWAFRDGDDEWFTLVRKQMVSAGKLTISSDHLTAIISLCLLFCLLTVLLRQQSGDSTVD
jgi:hypothetical protein